MVDGVAAAAAQLRVAAGCLLLCAAPRQAGGNGMSSAGPAPFVWAALVLFHGTVLAVWSGGSPALLLLLTPAPIILAGLIWRRPGEDEDRVLARSSLPTAALAIGVAIASLGAAAGPWLYLV